ncbi:hypothetical protein DFH09DRAFT_1278463 [Mycena vulgaris]|nr:hypothetical protein DFH09DRAFT_1278463 [Mycena vulgaris]
MALGLKILGACGGHRVTWERTVQGRRLRAAIIKFKLLPLGSTKDSRRNDEGGQGITVVCHESRCVARARHREEGRTLAPAKKVQTGRDPNVPSVTAYFTVMSRMRGTAVSGDKGEPALSRHFGQVNFAADLAYPYFTRKRPVTGTRLRLNPYRHRNVRHTEAGSWLQTRRNREKTPRQEESGSGAGSWRRDHAR